MPVHRRHFAALPLAAAGAALTARTAHAAGPGRGREEGTVAPSSVPFVSGTEGYDTFRIPAVVRTRRGTLVAFAEGRAASGGDTGEIDVVARRSTDGGRTWGPLYVVKGGDGDTHGNPAPVVDPRTGRITLLTCRNAAAVTERQIMAGEATAEQTRRVFVQHSDDDGRTWSAPAEITADVKRPDWRWYATGPGHALALTAGPYRGRLVVPANHSAAPPPGSPDTGTEARYYGGHCCYSDDGGRTWRIGFVDGTPDGEVNANESTAAQLPDGRVYFNARDQNGTAEGTRCDAHSTDGGRTLTGPYRPQPALVGPVVQGSVLQPAGGPLLYAGPADPAARARMTIRASTDGGVHWTAVHEVSALPAAYSDLVQVDRHTVGLLYETGEARPYETIGFVRVPLRALRPAG
ncbi:MAG TPA: sialidase family protein [Streptomyces sp.]|uniref:sialidase family protein n=1 Tax=Streptomyces sp. TaxID=1931 RepID=UPI002D309059|nr:sialidase family protein [Streptomyces sp.]HZG05853.1 sialidase family protein [Streptomyces sp.]